MSLYSRDSLAANSTLTVNVSGTAPPPGAMPSTPMPALRIATSSREAAQLPA